MALQPFMHEQILDIKFQNIHIYLKERNKVEVNRTRLSHNKTNPRKTTIVITYLGTQTHINTAWNEPLQTASWIVGTTLGTLSLSSAHLIDVKGIDSSLVRQSAVRLTLIVFERRNRGTEVHSVIYEREEPIIFYSVVSNSVDSN
jgi:hypothetical protein